MNKWDSRFLELARLIGSWSRDPSTKVGAAVIRPDRTIASTGYNGFPRRINDTDDRLEDRDQKLKFTIHAEINALLAAKEDVAGYTMYVWPCLPCVACGLLVIQAGIVRLVAPNNPELEARWGFGLTRRLFQEAGVALLEIPLTH